MIPVDLFSLLIGVVLGFGAYWMATHTDRWLDTSYEDTKKAAHSHER